MAAIPNKTETKPQPKTLSAKTVLSVMSRATPSNALKLTNPEVYTKISYSSFYTAIDGLKTDEETKRRLEALKDTMTNLLLSQDKYHFHTDKLYEFFILSLCEVLNGTQD
jgi:hypothetical protein